MFSDSYMFLFETSSISGGRLQFTPALSALPPLDARISAFLPLDIEMKMC